MKTLKPKDKYRVAKSIFKTAVKMRVLLSRYQKIASDHDIEKLDELILQIVQSDIGDFRNGLAIDCGD